MRTGFRISEILSLNVKDVQNLDKSIKTYVEVFKRNTKGKVESKITPLHPQILESLEFYLSHTNLPSNSPLFPSIRGARLERTTFHRNLKNAILKAKLDGKIATHTMRKIFATKIYNATNNDLIKTQRALAHKNIQSTVDYLPVLNEEIEDIIKKLK